ncbi:hypothetical protein T06_10399 [Trichinella sp. T6]|nr:hypothetical protein T06_10399 [Trichinella sp. T6]
MGYHKMKKNYQPCCHEYTIEQRLRTTQKPMTITQHSKEITDKNRSFFTLPRHTLYRTPPTVLMVNFQNTVHYSSHLSNDFGKQPNLSIKGVVLTSSRRHHQVKLDSSIAVRQPEIHYTVRLPTSVYESMQFHPGDVLD